MMQITVLGSAGSEGPGLNPTAFLIDDFMLLDAGTVSIMLDRPAQCRITHILLTHAHLDHVKAIPFLVDNFVTGNQDCQVVVLSGQEIIYDLRKNIFNNKIWPDFTTIPDERNPALRYQAISTRKPFQIGSYAVYATKVNHAVPAYGYMIEGSGGALLYTGDTGPTSAIWRKMRGHDVKALIIEVSFPNALSDLARTTGHLTPFLLEAEIRKMPYIPETIYISHLKPHYRLQIEAELARISEVKLEILEDGNTLNVP